VTTHDPTAYGLRMADIYDAFYAPLLDTDGAVARLAELAGYGPVLELGVGTGRLALPLAARGLRVHGVDSSEEMLERLRGKPGAEGVELTLGDITRFDLQERFSLAFAALNTLFAVGSQEEQIECFRAVGRHLEPGGLFVVEAFVLDPSRVSAAPVVVPRFWTEDRAELQIVHHDRTDGRLRTMLVLIHDGAVRLSPATHQYAWPGELDLMARLGGMLLRERWESWAGAPFTPASPSHVSVYARVDEG
jgi:SAM-dependent methyltransferase